MNDQERLQRGRESRRRYRESNREKLRAAARNYNSKRAPLTVEKRREYERRRFLKDRCKVLARNRDWRRRNPETVKAGKVEWSAKNRPRLLAEKRSWYLENAKRIREAQNCRRYGVTLAAFDSMMAAQAGRCATCDRAMDGSSKHRTPHIDHDHSTGRVRGLLCGYCNMAIGLLGDDPFVAERLSRYLFQSQPQIGIADAS